MAPTRPNPLPPRRKRASTPDRQMGSREHKTPQSAKRKAAVDDEGGDAIMTSEQVNVPPSPFSSFSASNTALDEGPFHLVRRSERNANRKPSSEPIDSTGTAIKKKAAAKSRRDAKRKVVTTAGVKNAKAKEVQQYFRFLDLPGEIRNMVYQATHDSPKQALLIHCTRFGTLRSQTRAGRTRPLTSDVQDQQLETTLASQLKRRRKTKAVETPARESNRPFFGLTQVCRQLRQEFRPIHLQKQEIGMDLTQVCNYLQTFYFDAPATFGRLFDGNGVRGQDMPFSGNLTIAVGETANDLEKSPQGIEVIPLLDLWANSFRIEAGFGRYLKIGYVPQNDGEAKDLYRLFGRRVLKNRSCSPMNTKWRRILRDRHLASVTLHRKPAAAMIRLDSIPLGAVRTRTIAALGPILPVPLPEMIPFAPKPFIHMLFRKAVAESWMTQKVSAPPPTWLAERGFGYMEHFMVKVGVAPEGVDKRDYPGELQGSI